MSELLPCPFCRGPAVNVADDYVTCGSAGVPCCAGKMVQTDPDTWNTRASPTDELVERVKLAMKPLVNENMDDEMRDAWLDDLARAALSVIGRL